MTYIVHLMSLLSLTGLKSATWTYLSLNDIAFPNVTLSFTYTTKQNLRFMKVEIGAKVLDSDSYSKIGERKYFPDAHDAERELRASTQTIRTSVFNRYRCEGCILVARTQALVRGQHYKLDFTAMLSDSKGFTQEQTFSSIQTISPSPLKGVTPLFKYPYIAFTHPPDSELIYDQLKVKASNLYEDFFHIQRRSDYTYMITEQNFTTERNVQIWTVSNSTISEKFVMYKHVTDAPILSNIQLVYAAPYLSVSMKYSNLYFEYAQVHVKYLGLGEQKTKNMNKQTQVNISLDTFPSVGIFNVRIEIVNGLRRIRSEWKEFILYPSPPRNVKITSAHKNLTIEWDAPDGPYHGFLITCADGSICPTTTNLRLGRNITEYTIYTNKNVASGTRLPLEIRSVFNNNGRRITSSAINITAIIGVHDLLTFETDYVRVSNTSLIRFTNFSIVVSAKRGASVSKVKVVLEHIDEFYNLPIYILEKQYTAKNFTNNSIFDWINPDTENYHIDHPVPGALYRFTARFYGVARSHELNFNTFVQMPPYPPSNLKLTSNQGEQPLNISWTLDPGSIQDTLIVKICSQKTKKCLDNKIADFTKTSYTHQRKLPVGTYYISMLALSNGVGSSETSPITANTASVNMQSVYVAILGISILTITLIGLWIFMCRLNRSKKSKRTVNPKGKDFKQKFRLTAPKKRHRHVFLGV